MDGSHRGPTTALEQAVVDVALTGPSWIEQISRLVYFIDALVVVAPLNRDPSDPRLLQTLSDALDDPL